MAAAVARMTIGLGVLLVLIGLHDVSATEDSHVVWVCSIDGNGICGPDTPPIIIQPQALLNW